MDLLISFVLIVVSSALYLYWSAKKAYRFFKDRNIPYIEPNFIFGNMGDVLMMRTSLVEKFKELYTELAPHDFAGVFTMQKPAVVIRNPDLLRNILIKDFAYFTDRGFNVVKEVDPLSNTLFIMRGDEWKNLRIKLTSTFTSGKMKMMFPLVRHCGEKLSEVIDQIPDNETFDAKDLFARYTTDTIGNCAFGLDMNSLNNPESEFRIMGRKVFAFRLISFIRTLWPNMPTPLVKLFKLRFIEKGIQDYFIKIIDTAVKYRERNNVTRNDFLDLMIALKNNTTMQKFHEFGDDDDLHTFLQQIGGKYAKSDVAVTDDILAAQAFVFFLGGFETSSTALGFALLELSQNQRVQDKLRREIVEVLSSNDGQVTYDVLKKMTYTDMVIDETLRKNPPVGMLFRETAQNYKIPNTQVTIPAGTSVIVPVYGMHMDEKYYENPEEFRPERFSEEEKAKRPNYTFLPFGDGPRVCIAERFGRLQVKVGLVYAIKNFSYHSSPKMKFPVEYQKSFGLLSPKDGVLVQKRKV